MVDENMVYLAAFPIMFNNIVIDDILDGRISLTNDATDFSFTLFAFRGWKRKIDGEGGRTENNNEPKIKEGGHGLPRKKYDIVHYKHYNLKSQTERYNEW
jgi:hypothetical protein